MFVVLKRPLVTEKSMSLASRGLYTFEVDKNARKDQIAKEVAKRFNVKVIGVKTITIKGELKTQRKVKRTYRSGEMKKAVVQVGKGQKIAIFETPKEVEEEVTVTRGEGEPVILKEKRDLLGKIKVKVEKSAVGAAPTTQRKVITGK